MALIEMNFAEGEGGVQGAIAEGYHSTTAGDPSSSNYKTRLDNPTYCKEFDLGFKPKSLMLWQIGYSGGGATYAQIIIIDNAIAYSGRTGAVKDEDYYLISDGNAAVKITDNGFRTCISSWFTNQKFYYAAV